MIGQPVFQRCIAESNVGHVTHQKELRMSDLRVHEEDPRYTLSIISEIVSIIIAHILLLSDIINISHLYKCYFYKMN